MNDNDSSPGEGKDAAGKTACVEVELDDDVAGIQALGNIAALRPIFTMPPGLIESIAPRMPTFESLGLSAAVEGVLGNISHMFTPEALGITDIVHGSRLTESLAAQLAAQMPAFKMPDVARILGDSITANLTGILSAEALGIASYTGWTDSLASSVLEQFDSSILRSLPSWLPDLATLRPHLPTNWRGVKVDVDEIEEDVFQILSEGIPLAWVPDKRVIGLLLDAPDERARRRIISNNYRGITETCLTVAASLPLGGRPLFLADMIVRAVHALQDGHVESAQALATNVLDTLLTGYSSAALGRSKGAVLNPSYAEKLTEERSWRLQLALRPSFTLMRGEHTVHERYNGFRRNATAHAVTSHQYSRINAVLSIMNATSVLTCFARDTEAFD